MRKQFVWFDDSLPQTLQIYIWIAYLTPIFGILMNGLASLRGVVLLFTIIFVLPSVLGAFGIANKRWWGWIVSLIITTLPFALGIFYAIAGGSVPSYIAALFLGPALISTIFSIAKIALLVHPMSWHYVKAYFSKEIP